MNENLASVETLEKPQKHWFPLKANGENSVVVLWAVVLLVVTLTYVMQAIKLVPSYTARVCLTMLLIVAYTAVAVLAMFVTGQAKQLMPTKNKLWLQILIGVGIAAALCFVVGVVPILCGTSLIGSHAEPSASLIIVSAIQDILFVGVGEEIVFRGYVQNQFGIWLKKCKWLSPLIAGALFGLWHIINGSWIQVLFTAVIGCVFGYCRYLIKNCTLLSVIVAHGLYDFSLVLLTCFLL